MSRIADLNRRSFLQTTLAAGAIAAVPGLLRADDKAGAKEPFKISLAQWSLHKTIFDKKLDNLDFAKVAKEDFGIEAIEYVNQFWKDKANDSKYVAELKQRAEDQ